MKRVILLMNFMALTGGFLSAQQNRPAYDRKTNLQEILNLQWGSNTAAKPTTEKRRVMAFSTYTQGAISDSVRNYYTGTRGSDISNAMENIMAASSFYLPEFEKQINRCDSFIQWGITENSTTIVPLFNGRFTYNNANMPSRILMGMFTFVPQHDLYYNTAGKLEHWDQASVAGNPADMRTFRKYNAQGKKAVDSVYDNVFAMQPVNKLVYSYNGEGKLDRDTLYQWENNAWTAYASSQYIYDPQGRLELVNYKDIEDGNGLANAIRISYFYSGSNLFASEEVNAVWENGAWVNDEKRRYTFNADNQPTNILYLMRTGSNDVLDTVEQRDITYTAQALVDDEHFYAYTGNAFETVPYRVDHWYYETYDDGNTTSIDPVTQKENTINIYPVPARNMLHIATRNGDMLLHTEMINSTGQTVRHDDGKNQKTMSLDISALSEGNYFLRATTQKGTSIQRFAIVR